MRKTSKSALYSTIKSTIEKLGISAEDTTGIINYIKFVENSVSLEPESKIFNEKRGLAGSPHDTILSVLSKDSSKPYSIQGIADATGLKYSKVQVLLRELKKSRKIKIVDYIPGSSGPSKVLYQTWKSPLRALKFVTKNQGYSTINGFMNLNKKLVAQGIGITSFAEAVEKSGIPSYPLALSIGITKGYKNTDLKSIALGNEGEEKPAKRKYTRRAKSNKPKRKYTRRAKVQPVEQPIADSSTGLGFIGKLFKRKNQDTSDLIKF